MAAHTGQPVETSSAAPAAVPQSSPGQTLYADNCSGCHGADATGGFGTDLTAATYQYGKTAEQVRESITAGRGDSMPPFDGQFSENELAALVDFLLAL
ncbi:MAG: hypothetical protein C0618_09110 [Desulfuromonas sp.]|nr:MAG: hypothetical protein C0618_09110 [Desulfuromonas sp.]